MRSEPLVEIDRGGWTESRHRGSVVVVDCEGRAVHVSGDDATPVFIRSAVKPFVAALLVSSGAADALGVEPGELAVAAGSHSGTDDDDSLVRALLARTGCTEADLRNGTGGPADETTATRMRAAGATPGATRQMCSGSHAAMLAIAAHAGWPAVDYHEPEHPIQREIATLIGRVFGTEDVRMATDDCAVPTWQVPLSAVARSYAWLARPERLPVELADLAGGFERVRDAMRANPDRVSGPGQLDTDLTATDGLVAKEGAEGLLAIGCVGAGLGVAVTVEDGDPNRRAAAVVALSALGALGALDGDAERRLREQHWPTVVDSVGRTIGEARPAFRMPRAG